MLGAIIGDTVGSHYEFGNTKDYNFKMFHRDICYTDDTVMTMAVAFWLYTDPDHTLEKLEDAMVATGEKFPCPMGGYGGGFNVWLFHPEALYDFEGAEPPYVSNTGRHPYNSFGNGSAMRVSPVGWFFDTLEETLEVAKISAEITHNHPEGIKGAQATAAAIFLARTGKSKEEIRSYIEDTFGYDLSKSWEYWHPRYGWESSCQGTVPQAIIAFLDSTDFEDAIRKAVSLGGDSDTLACITGGIAEAFYKEVPRWMADRTEINFPEPFTRFFEVFRKETVYGKLCKVTGEPLVEKKNPTADLHRFRLVQDSPYAGYEQAFLEMKAGQKRSHWIWYIFPQIHGMGHSFYSKTYAIQSLAEAKAYLEDEVLGPRLVRITQEVLKHKGEEIEVVMGSSLDAKKLCSCMTLFDLVRPDDVFAEVLEAFYGGRRDSRTLGIIAAEEQKSSK